MGKEDDQITPDCWNCPYKKAFFRSWLEFYLLSIHRNNMLLFFKLKTATQQTVKP